jgi:hypothetical protein
VIIPEISHNIDCFSVSVSVPLELVHSTAQPSYEVKTAVKGDKCSHSISNFDHNNINKGDVEKT